VKIALGRPTMYSERKALEILTLESFRQVSELTTTTKGSSTYDVTVKIDFFNDSKTCSRKIHLLAHRSFQKKIFLAENFLGTYWASNVDICT
jgi:hypothetical protein